MRVAFQMDDPAGFKLATDSTICLIHEAHHRGHEIFYYDPRKLTRRADGSMGAPLMALTFHENAEPWFSLGNAQWHDLSGMDVIMVRQDPPFDMSYITATYLLEMLPVHVKVVNAAAALRNEAEKLSPLRFKELMPPTLISADEDEINAFRAEYGEIVLKPLYSYGGRDVHFVPKEIGMEAVMAEVFDTQPNIPLVAQKFIPEVRTRELRVLMVNGVAEGAFARIPQGDEIRSNLRLGGRAELVELNAKEQHVCDTIGPWLKQSGLLFAGLDLIGGYLNEINVTSPTGLRNYQDLTGKNVAAKIWDAIG